MVGNGYQTVDCVGCEVVLQDVGRRQDFGIICDFLGQAAKTARFKSSRNGIAVRA